MDRLLVILGPTGTGKSDLAVRVAEVLRGEIIGCDAVQVYRGLDAATAKPTAAERARVPHHLVDCVEPTRDFSLGEYVRSAERIIGEIRQRGRLPLIVGGTGMYLRGLLRGVVSTPPRDERLRGRLKRVAQRRGTASLHRWLTRIDPGSAHRLPPEDTQRVVRALELALTGEGTWSERLRAEGSWAGGEARHPALKIGLFMERAEHVCRLDARVDRFFASGLVEETRMLLERGIPRESNAFKAIGYREILRAIDAGLDPESAREEVKVNTRRYAKRQRTWFRREPDVVWLDAARGSEVLSGEVVALWNDTR